ncbi:citrate synthase [Roseateles oligotrophus]|uniref:citrate synthase (unknown stereospecificity) n=1 Tax=Roseateles oligotrophus TaxID=1769250 RepID=A0ABT2YF58_9BURK|nr:citrate synthase [Roseateles oligotrophus]MCV2368667.1 excisionase [Roseateles oligotrophus]
MSKAKSTAQAPGNLPATGNYTLLDSSAAAARLGISKATLYAYVSRGLLSATADSSDPRIRRYSSFEVELLLRRKEGGRQREQQTMAALSDGLPVLDTALSGIRDGQPIYRGQSALQLAEQASAEDIARLLWQFDAATDPFAGPAPSLSAAWQTLCNTLPTGPSSRTLALFATALLDLHGPAWLPDGPALAQACAAHLRALIACFLARPPSALPMHQQFRQAWQLPVSADEPLRRALVLVADHEMNMVSFSARCLTSVNASLGAALLAAMCNLTATFNGGNSAQVEALWDELAAAPDLDAALVRRLDRGEGLPGFNHLSYPAGDPRARMLLAECSNRPGADTAGLAQNLAPAVERLTGWKPSIDFALVSLRRTLGAPPDAALTLQMAGRSIGVLAHMLEQSRSGQRLWATARYTGP